MNSWVGRLALVVAIGYVLALGWAMQRLSYDLWGAMIIGPLMVTVSVPVLRQMFRGVQAPLLPIVYAGLGAKLVGSMVRYWVTFDAYGGDADAGRYHDYGTGVASRIRDGRLSWLQIVPTGTGTQFIERLTASVYTMFGSSRMAGFILFGWMGFWGAVLYARAAMVAVPGLAERRYLAMMMLLPSMVYWPSSIGKEAWMMLMLGMASYGGARLFAGGSALRSLAIAAAGLLGAGLVRPHMAGMWLGGLTLALFGGLFVRRTDGFKRSKLVTLALLGVAVVALSFLAAFAIRYLVPGAEDEGSTSSAVTTIFQETERRSETGGSGFQTIPLTGPQSWPKAIVRTLTRPMLNEANSVAELLPAVEMTGLLLVAVVGWRRLANVPYMLRRSAYLLFAVSVAMMFGLAFTSIGNLAILTRQRSLVLPLLVLPLCLPPWRRRVGDDEQVPVVRELVPARRGG